MFRKRSAFLFREVAGLALCAVSIAFILIVTHREASAAEDLRVTYVAINGQALPKGEATPPLTPGLHELEMAFNLPARFNIPGMEGPRNLTILAFPDIRRDQVSDIRFNEDGTVFTAVVNIPENTCYQLVFAPNPGSHGTPVQDLVSMYYFGAAAPAASVSGLADVAFPEGFQPQTPFIAGLKYPGWEQGDFRDAFFTRDHDDPAAGSARVEFIGLDGAFNLPLVPDGEYHLFAFVGGTGASGQWINLFGGYPQPIPLSISDGQSVSGLRMSVKPLDGDAPPAPTPDFTGDGTVGFEDFLLFAGVFGARDGDDRYDRKFDLDQDGEIGFSDFLLFAAAFGKPVSEYIPPGQ